MKASIRNTEIYFDTAGMQLAPVKKKFVEKPVLFLLHGGPGGDHLRFKQTCLELQQVAQLVFIDFRGCGRSKKTKPADYTLKNNIEDIEALRKYLGLKRISILGASYGGIVAQGYAIRYAKNLDKLILSATSPSYRFLAEAKAFINKHGTKKQIKACEDLWNGTFKNDKHIKAYFKTMEPLYSNLAKKRHKNVYGKSQTVWSADAINKGFGDELRHYDFIPQLKKISCPTIVLAGKDDWICSLNQARTLAKHIPHAKLHIFKKSSHALASDEHKKFIHVVKKFMRA